MEDKKYSAKEFFLKILNSKLIIVVLFFTIFSLVIVLAGDVIVKEGSLNVGDDLNVTDRIILGGDVELRRSATDTLSTEVGDKLSIGTTINHDSITTNYIAMGTNGVGLFRWDGDVDNNALWLNKVGYNGTTDRFRDLKIGDGKGNTIVFVDGSTGRVGINNSVPAMTLDINGNVTANGFVTKSKFFTGDALTIIKGMSYDSSKNEEGEWRTIDHSKLGGAEVKFEYQTDDGIKSFEGQDVDKSIALLIRANQQLMEELCKKDNSYAWC